MKRDREKRVERLEEKINYMNNPKGYYVIKVKDGETKEQAIKRYLKENKLKKEDLEPSPDGKINTIIYEVIENDDR
jgi:hypothetical protein